MSHFNLRWMIKGYEMVVYDNKKERRQDIVYRNILDKDPNKIAQVLLDLEAVSNFPIAQAVKIYLQRRENKDWLGF